MLSGFTETPYNDSCFVIPSRFVIRASSFFNNASIQRVNNRLFPQNDVPPNEDQFRAIGFKRLQFPASSHEIEKLRTIGKADETFRANHARRQAICKAFETIAGKNFAGSECERFEFRLMPVFRRCDFSLASNSKHQFQIDPATLGTNNCRGWIDFAQLDFKRLDLSRLSQINLVQEQDICAFDLQPGRVTQFWETNKHVGVDD